MHYVLKHSKESFHNTTISLDCEQASMVTQHGKPMFPHVSNTNSQAMQHGNPMVSQW